MDQKVQASIGAGIAIAVLLLLMIAMFSFYSVPAGHKMVVTQGVGIGEQKDEGWGFMNPMSRGRINIRYNTQAMEETIAVLTSDGYNVPIDFQVTYHLQEDKVGEIATENPDYKDTVIRNVLRSEVRKTAADLGLTGEQLNTQRSAFESAVSQRVIARCDGYFIQVESVNVRNLDLPAQILDSAEKRASAKIDIETAQYELQAERARAQKEEMKAYAEANATVIIARGQAESIQILAQETGNMSADVMDYILSLRYIAALRDPESNVKYVIVPMDGQPLILDLSALEEAAQE